MRVALVLCCLAAALSCASGFFVLPCLLTAPAGCHYRAPQASAAAAAQGCPGSSCIASRDPFVTSRLYGPRSGLRMVADVEADGGSTDGTALAEARIVVHGQSTGGYFRAHARNEAHFNRKLCGALKELGGGQTEIIVEGKTSAIRSFLRWCKKGPGLSQRIEDVAVDWSDYTGIFDGFEVFPEQGSSNAAARVP